MFLNGRAAGGFGQPDGDEVYPVFGKSKRKLDFEEENYQQLDMEAQMNLQMAKRQRIAPPGGWADAPMQQEQAVGDADMREVPHQEINHNYCILNRQDGLDAYELHTAVTMEGQARQQLLAQAPQPQATPKVPQSNNVCMNINDETYSCYKPEMEEMAMESDGVPDPQQYRTEKLIFPCGENCIGGEHSPTSGRVKCYCRPSWEGMVGMVPYISDYY